VFRTRLPVASLYIAIKLLPLDLHVLSLPLAFILSKLSIVNVLFDLTVSLN
jgi:hypothetical protein